MPPDKYPVQLRLLHVLKYPASITVKDAETRQGILLEKIMRLTVHINDVDVSYSTSVGVVRIERDKEMLADFDEQEAMELYRFLQENLPDVRTQKPTSNA